MAISSVTWNAALSQLTITETDGSSTQSWPVVLSGLAPSFGASAESPEHETEDYLPTALFGQRTALLGAPSLWLGPFVVGGKSYAIPAFELPPAP
jgi:hypothetical protein